MCKLCETKPVYEFTNKRKLCKKCFIKYFQKKVLYTIRRFEMLKRDEVIGYKHNLDFRNVVLENILEMFAEKWMIKIVELRSQAHDINKQLIDNKRISKVAIGQSIDLTAYKIINTLINKSAKNFGDVAPTESKIIKPLYLVLDKEVFLYAKLKDLKFKKENTEKDEISNFIDRLEINHPEVKRAIVNGYLELYNRA